MGPDRVCFVICCRFNHQFVPHTSNDLASSEETGSAQALNSSCFTDLKARKGVARTIGKVSFSDQVWEVVLLGLYYD